MDKTAPLFARIPPPVWVLLYELLAWAISALADLQPVTALRQPVLGWLVIVAAIVLAVSAVVTFRRAGTEEIPASVTNKALVTHGPYRFTRNPMYLSLTLLTLGIALLSGGPLFFAVPLLVAITNNGATIPYEEAKMERQFGETFRAYKARVRRWI